jgi:hypothetical protein
VTACPTIPSTTPSTQTPARPGTTAEDEVVGICRDLIRIDTTNYGDGSGPGEREAAEHVAGLLAEVGLEPHVFESAPRRTSLVARIEGTDRSRPALLVHGTSTSSRPAPTTGRSTRSPARSATAACGAAVPST